MPDRRYYPPAESDIPLHGWAPYSEFHRERIKAHAKHKDKPGGSMEMKDFDEPDWLGVLMEEVGEVAQVLNDHRHGLLDEKTRNDRLYAELVQVGAMAAAWLDAIAETIAARAINRIVEERDADYS